jgi:hypothetical protein
MQIRQQILRRKKREMGDAYVPCAHFIEHVKGIIHGSIVADILRSMVARNAEQTGAGGRHVGALAQE